MPIARIRHRFFVGDGQRADTALHGAIDAEFLGEGARIDLADSRNAMLLQIRSQILLGAPIRGDGGGVLDHETGTHRRGSLVILGGDSGVADLHGRHGDDLTKVG